MVKSIGSNAFSGCSSLTNITFGDSITLIDDNAFSRCSKLTKLQTSLIVWFSGLATYLLVYLLGFVITYVVYYVLSKHIERQYQELSSTTQLIIHHLIKLMLYLLMYQNQMTFSVSVLQQFNLIVQLKLINHQQLKLEIQREILKI